jgi:ubiquinone/menaquinone biosynthesis C-methylase UbiE
MFSEPEKNIEQLGIHPNEIIADFGTGGGAYAIAAAKALKGTGRVYAVDVQKELLTRLQNTAREEKLGNLEVIWGNLDVLGGSKIRDGLCDVVIASNVLFQCPNKRVTVEEAKRVLKHSGRFLVIDWTSSLNNLGPRREDLFPEAEAISLIESLNFTLERHINAGSFHYGLIFRKGIYHAPSSATTPTSSHP